MNKKYKSKIGLEIVTPIIVVFSLIIVLITSQKSGWMGLLIMAPIILFVFHVFITTTYLISNNKLIIKSGSLYHKIIEINEIKMISETSNPTSSPALSLDRLEINYGKFDSVIISPKYKSEFIEDIRRINPTIEVRLKKK